MANAFTGRTVTLEMTAVEAEALCVSIDPECIVYGVDRRLAQEIKTLLNDALDE